MEQIQNGILAMMQAMAVQQMGSAGGTSKNSQAEGSEFQKLLEKQAQGGQTEDRKDPVKPEAPKKEGAEPGDTKSEAPKKPADSQDAPVKNQQQQDAATQERMVMAAMQMVQLPAGAVAVEVSVEPQAELVMAVTPEAVLPEQEGLTTQVETQGGGLMEGLETQSQGRQAQPQMELVPDAVPTAEVAPEAQPQAQIQTREEVQTEQPRMAETGIQTEAAAVQEEDGKQQITVEEAPGEPQVLFHDVEAAPIKVSESAAPEQSSPATNVEQQVTYGLSRALQQGESRIQIELTPESLGSVRVEITHMADGAIHVALSAENSQTRSLLERHAGNLQSILGSQGQGPVQVEVQRPQENQQHQQGGNPYEGHNGQNGQPQQEERRQHNRHSESGQDFLHQLRLGLIPAEGE